ncbi:MAG: hypothetical protein HGB12_02205 [Bacteroidetes bacterium]|nr:hypothetical protein [Bacteroidota bacterium]
MTTKNTFITVKFIVYVLFTFNFILSTFHLLAQSGGVAINSTGGSADNSTMLDISSTNQGMRIPRVALESTTSNAPIANPVNSLLVYDSVTAGDVTPGFYYWDGATSKWLRLATGSGGWSTSGNAGTDTATNFIGTTDDRSWVMKTNNTERMKISKTGSIGIGTPNPASSAILDISSTTKGLRMPNMTTSQRNLISAPVTGLQIYNTDCNEVNYYNGSCWISMGNSLPHPGNITSSPAPTVFCAGESRTYYITPVTGATSYIWTVPAGATINSGLGTTSINVTFGNISGNVCVCAVNNCETSPTSCIEVNVSTAPITPGNITGPITAVPGQTNPVSYSIASIAGATTYNWTVPPGASIISGQGTTNIVVNYSCSTTAGYVSVTQTAACGTSSPASSSITVNPLLVSAGPIKTGPGAIGGYPTASGGTGTGSYLYLWSPSTNLSSTSIANPTAYACVTTTYILTVTDANACTASSSVIVIPNLTASAGSDVFGGLAIGGSPTASAGTSPYTYSWSPATNLSSSTVPNPTAQCTGTTTTYVVTTTDAHSCTATSSVVVTRNLTASAGINKSMTCGAAPIGIGGSPTSSGGQVPYSYLWSPTVNLSSAVIANPTAMTSGTYTIIVTDFNTCTSTSSMVLTVTGGPAGSNTATFNTYGSSTWTIPGGVTCINIEAWGAQGGNHAGISTGGYGAYVKGTVSVSGVSSLGIIVGQQGKDDNGNTANGGSGGGGGSFVYTATSLYMAAGGGGGGSLQNDGSPKINGDVGQITTYGSASKSGAAGGTNGSDGSGDFYGKGWNSIQSSPAGVASSGGYGGGGTAGSHGGGGGGGYSGGGGKSSGGNGCSYGDGGGGGGSFNSGSNQTNTAGVQSVNGKVIITY